VPRSRYRVDLDSPRALHFLTCTIVDPLAIFECAQICRAAGLDRGADAVVALRERCDLARRSLAHRVPRQSLGTRGKPCFRSHSAA
jgi:hypothetical protein